MIDSGAKLEEIMSMWKVDSVYDPGDLESEIAKLPILHQRYMDLLVHARARKKRVQQTFDSAKRDATDHFKGRSEKPSPLKLTAGELDTYVKTDPEYQKNDAAFEMADITVDYLEKVIRVLSGRSYDLRAILEWRKFTEGP